MARAKTANEKVEGLQKKRNKNDSVGNSKQYRHNTQEEDIERETSRQHPRENRTVIQTGLSFNESHKCQRAKMEKVRGVILWGIPTVIRERGLIMMMRSRKRRITLWLRIFSNNIPCY